MIVAFVDELRAEGHAVESICRVLREQGCQVAARSYREWARANRTPAPRVLSDAVEGTSLGSVLARTAPDRSSSSAGWPTGLDIFFTLPHLAGPDSGSTHRWGPHSKESAPN